MKEDKASLSAIMTACIRAHHSMYDTPKIFDDFLAYSLIPQKALVSIKQYFREDKQFNDPEHTVAPSDQTITLASFTKATSVLSRARYTEDALEEAVRQGVEQYIILGAGLDTFAFRRPEMMDCLEVFEVDHPATQNFKLLRLAELGWKHPEHLHFIPIDFTKENLATALTRSSDYDSNVKSFFSWLGVTMYLTREEVFATLRSITDIAPEGSVVIFDYFDSDAFVPEKSSLLMKKKQKVFQKMGEKIITGFNPLTLGEDIASLGLSLHEDLSPEDLEKRYFKGRKDGHHAPEHGHIAYAIVKQ